MAMETIKCSSLDEIEIVTEAAFANGAVWTTVTNYVVTVKYPPEEDHGYGHGTDNPYEE